MSTLSVTISASANAPACVGDCNTDTHVSVDELLILVNIALGNADISACPAGDRNADNHLTVDEVVTAVNTALNGCAVTLPAATGTATATTTPTAVDPLVVMTGAGLVRGKTFNGVRSFFGIPFAAPPVGDLRWRPPMPHAPWEGVLAATTAGNVCTQTVPYVDVQSGEENCLFLNVQTPDPLPATPLPVMVWIYGGAFTTGDALQRNSTDGKNIVKREGMVVVSFNYRLGQLGFLAHHALTGEDPNHRSSGNYGIEDQIAALHWVHENIAAFGGDPGNVTIFGESAGGWSVCMHLASPRSAGLFQRAVVESGLCTVPLSTLAASERQGDALAAALNCTGTDVPACLRSKSATEVLNTLPPDPNLAFTPGTWGSWRPNIDQYVLSRQMAESFAEGDFNRVPVLIGSNKDEGTLFIAFSSLGTSLTADEYAVRLKDLLGSDALVAEVMAQYPLANYPDPSRALAAVFGDRILACPTIETGGLVASYVTTYLYQFEFPDAKFVLLPPTPLGAFHSAEIQYVFGQPAGRPFKADETQLSSQMMGYWTQFARTGDPNRLAALSWPIYDAAQAYLVLDRTIAAAHGPKAAACAFWKGLGNLQSPLQ